MSSCPRPGPLKLALYHQIARIRPITIGARLKRLLRIGRIAIKLSDERRYWIDPVSNLGLFLLRDEAYEQVISRIISAILREGDTFLDIGANEGYFTVLAGQIVGESGRVFAFEPQSRLGPVLQENIRLNGHQRRSTVVPEALMDASGALELHLTPDINTGATSSRRAYRHEHIIETVPATTLDLVLARLQINKVRLAKIDCEGAESEIVLGAADTIRAGRIEFLLVEYHAMIAGAESCTATDRVLVDAGYQPITIDSDHILYARSGDQSAIGRVQEIVGGRSSQLGP